MEVKLLAPFEKNAVVEIYICYIPSNIPGYNVYNTMRCFHEHLVLISLHRQVVGLAESSDSLLLTVCSKGLGEFAPLSDDGAWKSYVSIWESHRANHLYIPFQ